MRKKAKARTEIRLINGQALRIDIPLDGFLPAMQNRPEYLVYVNEVDGSGNTHEVALRVGAVYMARAL